jgi:hypothetical protein
MTYNPRVLPTIETAADMKALVIVTCCDIALRLKAEGDVDGAYALVTLVKVIECIPAKGDVNDL